MRRLLLAILAKCLGDYISLKGIGLIFSSLSCGLGSQHMMITSGSVFRYELPQLRLGRRGQSHGGSRVDGESGWEVPEAGGRSCDRGEGVDAV